MEFQTITMEYINRSINDNTRQGFEIDTMSLVYVVSTSVMSILSIIGCCLLIGTFVIYKELRTVCRRLLVFLTICDLFTAIGNTMGVIWYLERSRHGNKDNLGLCKLQSAWTILSSNCSFFWSVAIATHLYISIVIQNNKKADSLVSLFHAVCWCLPALITIVATAMDVFGFDKNITTASWCWISPDVRHQLLWQLFTGKLWEVAAYVIVALLYTLIKYHLIRQMRRTKLLRSKKHGDNSNMSIMTDANRKMTFVPAVFITVRIWGTLRFLLGAIDPVAASSVPWIAPLQGIGDSSQGFANCVLFCIFTERVRKRLFFCCRQGNKCASETCSSTHILTENNSDSVNKNLPRHSTTNNTDQFH